jgi:hypothetical protein
MSRWTAFRRAGARWTSSTTIVTLEQHVRQQLDELASERVEF